MLGDTILELIFPSFCIACGKRGFGLCLKCFSTCPVASRECPSWVFPLYDYQCPKIKKIIHLLKYQKRRTIARTFVEILYLRILEELADLKLLENFNDPILIPIPLTKKRLRERGFNQALLLAQQLIKKDNEKNFKLEKDVLIKIKNTKPQASIESRNERLKNIIGCFLVKNPKKVKGKNIILIDDVFTTGATLSEAKKVLKKAGAKKIIAFVLAH